MEQLATACIKTLDQLENILDQIQSRDYCRPCLTLGSSTIGQHVRHTLEFFLCLERGVSSNIINYDKRGHDRKMETDKFLAIQALRRIRNFVASHRLDKVLQLEVGYERHSDEYQVITTNLLRELAYNIEHAVHHMAIMKIGINEVAPYVQLAENFGVASSTVRYKSQPVVRS